MSTEALDVAVKGPTFHPLSAGRKIKNTIENIRWNRTRFERTNHAPIYDNVGELHYADLKIT